MSGGAICGGGGSWGRLWIVCPTCARLGKRRRRALMRSEMGGWGSRCLCGGCGATFSDGERCRTGKAERAFVRAFVRSVWPTARPWREVVQTEPPLTPYPDRA